jgi:hypothetical protein
MEEGMANHTVKNEVARTMGQRKRADVEELDRRSASRNMLVASAEADDITHGLSVSARTSDISVHGCYLDTMNPFSPGTRIRVHLTKENETFHSLAVVIYSHEGMGMGVAFTEISEQGREILQSWTADLESGRESTTSSNSDQNTAMKTSNESASILPIQRLARILEKKGMLTRQEVREILN